MDKWEQLYDLLGIKEFIYFISSPSIQDSLLGIKLVFIAFTVFFFCAVIYFYLNSSFLRHQFLQDSIEFFSWQSFGLREVNNRWKKIMKNIKTGTESEYKLAIIEADDFLYQIMEDKGLKGDSFEELLASAGKKVVPDMDDLLTAHQVRNSIVYDANYSLEAEKGVRIMSLYEFAIKNISLS